jgi:hypothetical protein
VLIAICAGKNLSQEKKNNFNCFNFYFFIMG